MLTGTVVLKEDHIQLVTDEFGDMPSTDRSNYGLYFDDTRYLSAYDLRVNGVRPLYLSHSADRNYIANFQFVNPQFTLPSGHVVPRQTISIRRTRFVDGVGFYERLGFFNCNHFNVELEVTVSLDADFRDILAVRGFAQQRLAGRHSHEFGPQELTFTYIGRDKVIRRTEVKFSVPPEPISSNAMVFRMDLQPHVAESMTISVRPSCGRRRRSKVLSFDDGLDKLASSYETWNRECTEFKTDNEYFDRSLLRQSRLDIRTLLEWNDTQSSTQRKSTKEGGRLSLVPSAGIPWYAVPFGRDAIIAALQTLMYNPAIAEGTLRFLAQYQGTKVNRTTEEEPGKIFHELRRGELANLQEIPHLPYYGTVDATPLFVVLFVETMAWLGSDQLYQDILPHALRALEWIDGYGDVDGDGYVEYEPKGTGGVRNQGWKDSIDSLQYENGDRAHLPAALVEVQGYIYQAKMGLSRLMASRGSTDTADRLRSEASALKKRFNVDFWVPEERYFAQALDRDKGQIRSITSNAGHCLWADILDPDKAAAVVSRLMDADMFSGWGIRTLSGSSPNYNPMSYHNGSVWPHDNAIIALGMRRHGFVEEASEVISAMIEAGLRFPSNRLPELFCGFTRDRRFNSSPMAYIKSCSPQAWSAASPFLFLQTILDARPDDGGRTLRIDPAATSLFHRFHIEHLRTGAGRASLSIRVDEEKSTICKDGGSLRLRTQTAEVISGSR